MNIDTLLDNEIQSELEQLKNMEVGTEEYKAAVEGITKLIDRKNERDRLANEKQDRAETQAIENGLRMKQISEDRIDRYLKNGIAIAGILLPLGVTIWGTIITLKFEEEGSVTTIMGRGFINKLFPKK